MNLMARGQAMLNRVLGDPANGAGVVIAYERPNAGWKITLGADGLALTAVPGFEQATAETVGTTLKPRKEDAWRDYLIRAADLVVGGKGIIPKSGDRITETLGGVPVVFELTPRGNEPAARFHDYQRTKYRVHAKRVL